MIHRATSFVARFDLSAFVVGLVAVNAADVATTGFVVFEFGLSEANPFVAALIEKLGFVGLLLSKIVFFALFGVTMWLFERPDPVTRVKLGCLTYGLIVLVAVLNNVVWLIIAGTVRLA